MLVVILFGERLLYDYVIVLRCGLFFLYEGSVAVVLGTSELKCFICYVVSATRLIYSANVPKP